MAKLSTPSTILAHRLGLSLKKEFGLQNAEPSIQEIQLDDDPFSRDEDLLRRVWSLEPR